MGAVVYNRCVTLGIEETGLYVAMRGTTALVPWAEFKGVDQVTLHWQKMPRLTVGDPPVTKMTVPAGIFEQMRGRLPAGLGV
jgi:hypothetical protein